MYSLFLYFLLSYMIQILLIMEQHALKNVNNCLNVNICSYLETSRGQSSNLYLNAVHFFNTSVNQTSVVALDSCFPLLAANTCCSIVIFLNFSWTLLKLKLQIFISCLKLFFKSQFSAKHDSSKNELHYCCPVHRHLIKIECSSLSTLQKTLNLVSNNFN